MESERRREPKRLGTTGGRACGSVAALLVLAGLLTSMAANAGPAHAEATWTPVLTVSKTANLSPDGETLTVSGTGFDPEAHTGTRAPLSGKPSGFYIVFGRFGDPWAPSSGAPSSARQAITQKWALPAASRALLDPNGTSKDIITIAADGTFSTTIDAKTADGTGGYAIATYPGSGAVDPSQELRTPVTFASPPVNTGTGTGTGTGGGGQSLVVAPVTNLNPEGQDVTVKGTGYDSALGVYVALCVDNGATEAPSPCVGGADQSGRSKSAAWITSHPPPYATGLATPFGAGGTFDVVVRVQAKDEYVDCFAAGTRCVLASRADHTAGANRTADVKVPVHFTGQQAPVVPQDPIDEPDAVVTLAQTEVAQGGTVGVTGSGFVAGEQVQVWMHSTPQVIAVADASAAGTIAANVTIPADAEVGMHHIKLVGITSGRTVASATFTVVAAAVDGGAALTTTTTAPVPSSSASPATITTASGSLPATGAGTSGDLAAGGLALVALGTALVLGTRPDGTFPQDRPMTSVDELTDHPPMFSAVIRDATWQDHESNEGSPFMRALLDGALPVEGYARLAAQQWFVYAMLEDAADAERSDPVAGPFVSDELTRLPSIEADLRVLVGDDWSQRIEALPATTAYCDRMRAVCFDQPGAFVAHHYTRYLGDLSGGQHIARVVRRVYDLEDDRGAAFFHFAGIASPKDFKDRYRRHLDAAPWTPAEQAAVIAEVRNAYRLNRDLVADLDATVA